MEHIGKLIKKYRTQKGFSQTQLAKIVGIDRTTLAKYESEVNQPPFDVVADITEALHVNMINEYFNKYLSEQTFLERVIEQLCDKNDYLYEEYEYVEGYKGRPYNVSYRITRFSKEKGEWLTFTIERDDLSKLMHKFVAHMSIELSAFLDELEEQEEYGTEE